MIKRGPLLFNTWVIYKRNWLTERLQRGNQWKHKLIMTQPGRNYCWYSDRKTDPIFCPINGILEFLATNFDKDCEYNTIYGYRSAISVCHGHISNKPAGKHLDEVNF